MSYVTPSEAREFLTGIDLSAITDAGDVELAKLISRASHRLDAEVGRSFSQAGVTGDRYDDPGTGKLALRNWPIVSISQVRFYDHDNNLVRAISSTDQGFSRLVIVDKENGLVEFATLAVLWRGGAYQWGPSPFLPCL